MTTKQTKTPVVTTKARSPRIIAARNAVTDPVRVHAIHAYESALKLMHDGKFEKASAAFEKLLETCPSDLGDRVRVHKVACERQLKDRSTTFGSIPEQYDFAVSLLNDGLYEDAREHLSEILLADRDCDYAYYGMAVLHSMTGDAEACLEMLGESIRLNPKCRIQARGDSDFQDMLDDPRFTELLYPESA